MKRIDVDVETYDALADLAAETEDNVASLARDILRESLTQQGYAFTTTPVRRNRRGSGRKPNGDTR